VFVISGSETNQPNKQTNARRIPDVRKRILIFAVVKVFDTEFGLIAKLFGRSKYNTKQAWQNLQLPNCPNKATGSVQARAQFLKFHSQETHQMN
jgi:hypothetical protein